MADPKDLPRTDATDNNPLMGSGANTPTPPTPENNASPTDAVDDVTKGASKATDTATDMADKGVDAASKVGEDVGNSLLSGEWDENELPWMKLLKSIQNMAASLAGSADQFTADGVKGAVNTVSDAAKQGLSSLGDGLKSAMNMFDSSSGPSPKSSSKEDTSNDIEMTDMSSSTPTNLMDSLGMKDSIQGANLGGVEGTSEVASTVIEVAPEAAALVT
jgi:hypothetical protein